MEAKDTKLVGNITELEVMLYMSKLGYQVSIPHGDRARYDQIWDIDGKLIKVQVKTAHPTDDETSINVNCHTSNRSHGKIINKRYTKDEIDCIATYYNNRCYCIPIDKTPSRCIKLRKTKTLNGQLTGVNILEDFEVEKIIERHRKNNQ